MNLKTALKILKENLYIVESDKFAEYDQKTVGNYAELRKKNREAMTAKKSGFNDPKRYNDCEGSKWLNVNSKDYNTIAMAALDGWTDTGRGDDNAYASIKSAEDLAAYMKKDPRFDDRLNSKEVRPGNYDDSFIDYVGIWPFLKQFMGKGKIKVYRGVTLSSEMIKSMLVKDKYALSNKEHLIKALANENKEFNSYSVDYSIAQNFSGMTAYNDPYFVILEGEADNKDINWAFTAYLFARHGSTVESELNINNSKPLSNLKIKNCRLPKQRWELEYDAVKRFQDFCWCKVKDEEDIVLVKPNGESLTDDTYDDIIGGSDRGWICVSAGYKGFNFVNVETGEYISDEWFDTASPFYDDCEYTDVTNNNKYYRLYDDGHLEEKDDNDF